MIYFKLKTENKGANKNSLLNRAKKKCQNMLNPNVPKFLPRDTEVHIDSQNIQQAGDDYHMCIICYTNHLKTYNCQTDMQNGFASSDQDNFTPSEFYQWLKGQNIPKSIQSNFEDYDSGMSTGYSSSDEENWTPKDSAQWLGQEVAQVTEGLFNPYQNGWFYQI